MIEASQTNTYGKFIQVIKDWLGDLGENSKFFSEIMGDEALPMPARALASGVLLYLQIPTDLIPNKYRFIGLIDDVTVMIVGLVIVVPLIPQERLNYYGKKYEPVGKVDDYKQTMQATLGILWERLVTFVERLRERTFKDKTTEEVVQSPELLEDLLDETMIFVANLNLDPESLDNELGQLPSPEKIISLLSSGLEEEQKQQTKHADAAWQTKSAFKRLLLSASGKQDRDKSSAKEKKLLK